MTLPAVGTLRSSHHIPRPAEGNEHAAQGSQGKSWKHKYLIQRAHFHPSMFILMHKQLCILLLNAYIYMKQHLHLLYLPWDMIGTPVR